MRAETAIPQPANVTAQQPIPQSSQMVRTMELQVHSSLEAMTAFHKTAKALKSALAEKVPLERGLKKLW